MGHVNTRSYISTVTSLSALGTGRAFSLIFPLALTRTSCKINNKKNPTAPKHLVPMMNGLVALLDSAIGGWAHKKRR